MSANGRWQPIHIRHLRSMAYQGLTPLERNVWLDAMAGPQTKSMGVFSYSLAVAAEGLPPVSLKTFTRSFEVVCQTFGWQYDTDARVLWVPTWLDDHSPQSPKVVISWRKLLNDVPACAVRTAAIAKILAFLQTLPEAYRKPFESLSENLSQSLSVGLPIARTPYLVTSTQEPGNPVPRAAARRRKEAEKDGRPSHPDAHGATSTPDPLRVLVETALSFSDPTLDTTKGMDLVYEYLKQEHPHHPRPSREELARVVMLVQGTVAVAAAAGKTSS